MSDGLGNAAASVAHIVRDLRPLGVTLVLWTVVVCTALWHCQPSLIEKLWPYLFFTWLGLIVVHLASVVFVSIGSAVVQAKELAPEISAEPSPRVDPSLQP